MSRTESDEEDLNECNISNTRCSFCSGLADEFINSENAYRASIDVLCVAYIQPLMNVVPSQQKEVLESFFGDIYNIVACHNTLNRRIQSCGTDDVSNFPFLLVEFIPSFHQFYNNYILGFGKYTEMREELYRVLTPEWFDSGCRALADDMKRGNKLLVNVDVSLESLMIMPMQRLVRYSLLTDEWIKTLLKKQEAHAQEANESEKNSKELILPLKAKETQQAIYALCASANVSKEIMVNAKRIMELEKVIGVEGIFKDEHKLLNEGIFLRATKSDGAKNWKFRRCRLILFDQSLYVVKVKDDNSYRSYQKIPLGKVKAVRNVKSDPAHSLHAVGGFLLHYDEPRLEMVLLDDDELSMSAWIRDINFAIDAWTTPPSASKFDM